MVAKFDLHVHSSYSDGKSPPALMVEAAEAEGLEAVAITDHGPDLSVGIKRADIPRVIEEVRQVGKRSKVRVLLGFETNVVNELGAIDIDESVVEQIDFLSMGIHYVFGTMEPSEVAKVYLRSATNAIDKNKIDIFAHPFFLHGPLLPYLAREEIERFVRLAAERGTAMEINVKYRAPDEDFLQLCLKEGVKLSVGSDAHRREDVGKVDWALGVIRQIGAKKEDLVLENFL